LINLFQDPKGILEKGPQLLLKSLDLRVGKRSIYKHNFTSYKGNLPERKEGVGFFFFRLSKW
jgi:hypothetical protein